jgi:hypothetical protein
MQAVVVLTVVVLHLVEVVAVELDHPEAHHQELLVLILEVVVVVMEQYHHQQVDLVL